MALSILFHFHRARRAVNHWLMPVALASAGMTVTNNSYGIENFRSAGDFYMTCSRQLESNSNKFAQTMSNTWQQCYSYTSAVLSTLDFTDGKSLLPLYCIPSFLKVEKSIYITVNYLRDFPEERTKVPALAILQALDQHYPCESSADVTSLGAASG